MKLLFSIPQRICLLFSSNSNNWIFVMHWLVRAPFREKWIVHSRHRHVCLYVRTRVIRGDAPYKYTLFKRIRLWSAVRNISAKMLSHRSSVGCSCNEWEKSSEGRMTVLPSWEIVVSINRINAVGSDLFAHKGGLYMSCWEGHNNNPYNYKILLLKIGNTNYFNQPTFILVPKT